MKVVYGPIAPAAVDGLTYHVTLPSGTIVTNPSGFPDATARDWSDLRERVWDQPGAAIGTGGTAGGGENPYYEILDSDGHKVSIHPIGSTLIAEIRIAPGLRRATCRKPRARPRARQG